MQKLFWEELQSLLEKRKEDERLDLCEREIRDMDLGGWDLHNIDFKKSAFHNVNLNEADMCGCSVENALFQDTTLCKTKFQSASLKEAVFRYCDMTGCDICGADLYCAVLEYAVLDNVVYDDETKWFRMHCPETGAFLGYKKCVNDRMVQLLIPADAKRTSATLPSCRCSKAKVLTIKSFDYSEQFHEAWSLVDENFVYRVGEWVEVKDFNEDRWMDSTTGIHFWMTREEAKAY